MRKDSFNNRTPRNVLRSGKRGTAFNASRKLERHRQPKPYYAKGAAERQPSSWVRDVRRSSRTAGSHSQRSSEAERKNRRRLKRKRVKSSFRSFLLIIASAVIITTSYSTMVDKREAEALAASITQADKVWLWNGSLESATVLLPEFGTTAAEVVYEDIVVPDCTNPGRRLYTATAVVSGVTLTDTREKRLPALGHEFGEPELETDGEGITTIHYSCDRCGQKLEVELGMDKE